MNHTPDKPCTHCRTLYTAEREDFGLCCICERDLIGLRVVGPHWVIRTQAASALLAACEDAADALHRLANGQGTVSGITLGDAKRIGRAIRDNLQVAIAATKGE